MMSKTTIRCWELFSVYDYYCIFEITRVSDFDSVLESSFSDYKLDVGVALCVRLVLDKKKLLFFTRRTFSVVLQIVVGHVAK